MRKIDLFIALATIVFAPCLQATEAPEVPVSIAGLVQPVALTRDENGLTHISARNDSDLYFMQGWVHARDRLFQMDVNRRTASGTLAELLGSSALAQDVQLRTLGLRRASERSLAALLPETHVALNAYAHGVNAYVATHPLPPEYRALHISRFAGWTPLDSVTAGRILAFELSFELDVDATIALESYRQAGVAAGFDGLTLYFEDLDRAAPFDPASTIPDATQRRHRGDGAGWKGRVSATSSAVHPVAVELAKKWRTTLQSMPAFSGALERRKRPGSNLWAVSGTLTTSGRPMIANDQHLSLSAPAIWYPIGLESTNGLDVFGVSFAGVPSVITGYNRSLAWGSTNTLFDVTDTYQEQVVTDPASPSGLSTIYKGQREPIIPVPQVYRVNQLGSGMNDVVIVPPDDTIPAVTLIVPRRNNGPIVQLDAASGIALSVQWTGFSATREADSILKFPRARSLADFTAALQYFDVGSQNWVVGDERGNIAFFTSGEVPVREDLQAGYVNGLPPHFIRNGAGGNEWMPISHPQPSQALSYEILPFSELPQITNPPAGFFVNANNDPVGVTLDNDPLNTLRPGGGIFYLSYTFDDPSGLRAGQITERISRIVGDGERRVSFDDMQSIQADVTLRDAQFFTRFIIAAYERGIRPGAQPLLATLARDRGIAEAVLRLRRWDYTSRSGLTEGWDAHKPAGFAPSQDNVSASVATTLYTAWRSRFIANTVDRVIGGASLPLPDAVHTLSALRNLLVNFPTRGGRGASGLDFFVVPGVAQADDRRDILMLSSMRDALAVLASPALAPAFAQSTKLEDYRWGKLHRIVFDSVLGSPFSIPPAGGTFPAPLVGLEGIPTDGGLETVDAAGFNPRGFGVDSFMFSEGPSHRFVAEVSPSGTRAEDIWPGGTSGVLGSPFYAQFLRKWLANETVPLRLGNAQEAKRSEPIEIYGP